MIFRPLSAGVEQTLERVRFWRDNPGTVTGLQTGFKPIDDHTGGLEPTDLVVLGGRPGMGKTALALNIAARVAKREAQPVLFVSTEMPAELLRRRLAAIGSGVNEHKLRVGAGTPDEYARFETATQAAGKLPLYVADSPGVWTENPKDPLDPNAIGGAVRLLARDVAKPLLIVVDHLSRIGDNPGESANYRIGGIARNLKNLAMEVGTPVLALSQLNRQVEQRDDKRPQLADLRDSGEVEQEADAVWLIYRQDYYLQPDQAGYDRRQAGKCLIDVAKARSGPTGHFLLNFDAQTTRFS